MKKVCVLLTLITTLFIQNFDCEAIGKLSNASSGIEKYENSIIISKIPIKSIKSSDVSVANAYIMPTVMNERNVIIIEAYAKGESVLDIVTNDNTYQIKVVVKKKQTLLSPKYESFEYVTLDMPSEVFQYDVPPEVEGE